MKPNGFTQLNALPRRAGGFTVRALGPALCTLAALLATTVQVVHAQPDHFTIQPIGEVDGQLPFVAAQSSDFSDNTPASLALPYVGPQTLAVPTKTTPAYTQQHRDPWWQMDLRVRRHLSTVAARACEGDSAFGGIGLASESGGDGLVCNDDYGLSGAWVLVSDVPFPLDPWAASAEHDPDAVIARFPIMSNGYQQAQLANVERTARYLRIQFPPGTTRALAIEKIDLHGYAGVSNAVIRLSRAFDALFPETLSLISHLADYRDAAVGTEAELARTQERGRELEKSIATTKSVANRISRLDRNIASATRTLSRAELLPPLKNAARATKRTLERIQQAVKRLKTPAKHAREKLEHTQQSLRTFNAELRKKRVQLGQSIVWSATEETAVAGLYHCEVADAKDPTAVVDQPLAAPLESYAGFRNEQFEVTAVNTRVRDFGAEIKVVNNGLDKVENTASSVNKQLRSFENALALVERPLNDITSALQSVEDVLDFNVCLPFTSNCLSVNDVLQFVADGKSYFGLEILEEIANGIIDPILDPALGALTAAFPAVPALPDVPELVFPDVTTVLDESVRWGESVDTMRDLLKTPSIFACAESGNTIEDQRRTDPLWQYIHDMGLELDHSPS